MSKLFQFLCNMWLFAVVANYFAEPVADAKQSKTESKPKNKTNGQADAITQAAKAAAEKAKVILTPSQAIGQFADTQPKENQTKLKNIYDGLLDSFAQESQSRITIGKLLMQAKDLLGDSFGGASGFLKACVVDVLRKSEATCYNYMALASAATVKFAKNPVVSTALFRIWGAEGAYDTTNGKLKDAVDMAIAACGGIPEERDSALCESWARKFIQACDSLTQKRNAQVDRTWDLETIKKKHESIKNAFSGFLKNKSVNSKRATALLTDLLIVAANELSVMHLRSAWETMLSKRTETTGEIKEHSEESRVA